MNDSDFVSIVVRERQRFVRYVRRLLSDTAEMEAEDIVQEVLVRMLERPDSQPPLDNVAAYVFRALRNRVIDASRTRKPTQSLFDETGDERLVDLLKDFAPEPMEVLQNQEMRSQLFAAMEVLNEMERKVLIAHEFEGVSFKSMASEWHVPQNTLLSHKSRAIRKLRKQLLDS